MRIISGTYKKRKILAPEDKKTRPLKDLVKESIFNIIHHSNKFDVDLSKSSILDLFSGVGSFGIECLSRGAKEVFFIENYKNTLSILKKNLIALNIDNYSVVEKNIYHDKEIFYSNKKFNLIFIDPPYKDRKISMLLKKIYDSDILFENSLIILHRHKNVNDEIPDKFKILETKRYGISKLIFLTLKS